MNLLVETLKTQIERLPGSELLFIQYGEFTNFQTPTLSLDHPSIRVLSSSTNNSYVARNIGITNSKNAVIAFIDADCMPANDWLSNAAELMKQNQCDLFGGAVHFENNKTGAQLYDSLAFLQMKDCVEKRNVALTLNLIVKRSLFQRLGLFQEQAISGSDVEWTRNAVQKGYRLQYANSVSVTHPLRSAWGLVIKAIRVGRGKAEVQWNLGELQDLVQIEILSPLKLFARAQRLGRKFTALSLIQAVCCAWMVIGLSSMSYAFTKITNSRRAALRLAPRPVNAAL